MSTQNCETVGNPLANVHNYTRPKWGALIRAVDLAGLPNETCAEFMWMCEQPAGVHQYKHRGARNYAHLRGTEDREDCERAIAHARSMAEKWPDRPRMAWELRAQGCSVHPVDVPGCPECARAVKR